MVRVKITDKQLAEIIKNSNSFMEVLRKLGLKEAGGTHSHYKRRANSLNIDTSHFVRNSWNRGKVLAKKRVASNILVLRKFGGRQKSKLLTRALLEVGIKHKCSKCGQPPMWLNNPLTLDVDHINENWLDDRVENLRFLCPNCHSQFTRHLI